MFFFPDIAKIEKTNPGLISERQSGLEKPKYLKSIDTMTFMQKG